MSFRTSAYIGVAIRSPFCIERIVLWQGDADCHVAALLAMTQNPLNFVCAAMRRYHFQQSDKPQFDNYKKINVSVCQLVTYGGWRM